MKIGIIGLGKVGGSFLAACNEVEELEVTCAKAGRSTVSACRTGKFYEVQLSEDAAAVLMQADLLLLTVPDGQIKAVAEELAGELLCRARLEQLAGKVCLHCSGCLGLEPLEPLAALGVHCGSLHPLQSFAQERPVFKGIGMAVEGDPKAVDAARLLAVSLQARPFSVPASERRAYHAAACFCSNYLVTLTAIAQQLLARWTTQQEEALEFLLPLLEGTVANLQRVRQARDALTGPIARGDTETVAGHLSVLPENLQRVYRELGQQTVALARDGGTIDEQVAADLQNLLRKQE